MRRRIAMFYAGSRIGRRSRLLLVAAAIAVAAAGGAQLSQAGPLAFCLGLPATIVGNAGPNVIVGTPNDDVIAGLDGSDTIFGMGGHDRICGDAGNDALYGGPGDDWLFGGTDGDTLAGNADDDHLFGGPGHNRASFASSPGPVTAGTTLAWGEGNDVLNGIQDLEGSAFADTLIGDAQANRLIGRSGNDRLIARDGDDHYIGGPGEDTADFSGATGPVTASLTTGVATGEGSDELDEIEDLRGSPYSDTLTGDNGPNVIHGGPGIGGGQDTLSGEGGADLLDGGAEDDMLVGGDGSDQLLGGSEDDMLVGGDGDDQLLGGGENDRLFGNAGNDRLVGGPGDDWFSGGDGDADHAEFSNAGGPVTASLATGLATGEGTDRLDAVEELEGSSYDDTLTGDDNGNVIGGGPGGKDTLFGLGGNDLLQGGASDDTLYGGDGIDALDGGVNDTPAGDVCDAGPGGDPAPVNCETIPSPNVFLSNAGFEAVGPTGASTSFTGIGAGGYSAADNWTVFDNAPGTTSTDLVPSTAPDGTAWMIHVTTTGDGNGLVQAYLPSGGPVQTVSSVWVYVIQGQVGIGTGDGGNTGIDLVSSQTGQWELLQAPNGISPANELVIYSVGGGAEFYADTASVS